MDKTERQLGFEAGIEAAYQAAIDAMDDMLGSCPTVSGVAGVSFIGHLKERFAALGADGATSPATSPTDYCLARSRKGFDCTLAKGHAGLHMAHGEDPNRAIASWAGRESSEARSGTK